MDFNIDVRRKQLESLNQFICSSRNRVQNILDTLKWTADKVNNDTSLIKCSVDSSHRVPAHAIEAHIKKCSLLREGYDLKEEFLSEPVPDPQKSIFIDDFKKVEIFASAHRNLPGFRTGWNGQDPPAKTADRNLATFSSDERLALYNYAIANTAKTPELPEFNTINPPSNENKSLSYEEKLALERDAKRRRIKYKSVHTNHKNHTEVMREVIENQMELYKEWLNNKSKPITGNSENQEDKTERCENSAERSIISQSSTYSSSSKHRSRNHSRDRSGYSRSKEYYHKSYREREYRSPHRSDRRSRYSPKRHEKSYRHKRHHS